LGYEWLRNRREFGWRGALGVGIVPVGLAGYMTFLWIRFGDPFITMAEQRLRWGREPTNPLTTLKNAWTEAGEGMRHIFNPTSLFFDQLDQTMPEAALEASRTVDLAFLFLFLFLIGVGLVVLPLELWGLWSYTFFIVMLHLIHAGGWSPLLSLPRFVLDAFLLFFVLGYLLSYSRLALYVWVFVSGGLGAVLAALFVTGHWVA
jgi:hypothetical protein